MVVIVVYVVCVVLDLLRIRFVETPFFNWLDKTEIYDKVTQRLTGKDPKIGGIIIDFLSKRRVGFHYLLSSL